jgi:hypothetical protein
MALESLLEKIVLTSRPRLRTTVSRTLMRATYVMRASVVMANVAPRILGPSFSAGFEGRAGPPGLDMIHGSQHSTSSSIPMNLVEKMWDHYMQKHWSKCFASRPRDPRFDAARGGKSSHTTCDAMTMGWQIGKVKCTRMKLRKSKNFVRRGCLHQLAGSPCFSGHGSAGAVFLVDMEQSRTT